MTAEMTKTNDPGRPPVSLGRMPRRLACLLGLVFALVPPASASVAAESSPAAGSPGTRAQSAKTAPQPPSEGELVQRALRQIEARRYVDPKGDNAYETCLQLQKLNPASPAIPVLLKGLRVELDNAADRANYNDRGEEADRLRTVTKAVNTGLSTGILPADPLAQPRMAKPAASLPSEPAPVIGPRPDRRETASAQPVVPLFPLADPGQRPEAPVARPAKKSMPAAAHAAADVPALISARPAAAPPKDSRPVEDVMIDKAVKMMAAGDIASARSLFEAAAAKGSAQAAFGAAKTYDPDVFRTVHAVGIQPDAKRAVEWYRKAAEGGEPEAKKRLVELGEAN